MANGSVDSFAMPWFRFDFFLSETPFEGKAHFVIQPPALELHRQTENLCKSIIFDPTVSEIHGKLQKDLKRFEIFRARNTVRKKFF